MAYAEPSEALQALVGAEGKAEVTLALDAASGEIDSAFSRAGYATPLDTTLITDAVAKARFDAQLVFVCRALAAGYLASVPAQNRRAPAKSKKDYDLAKSWLKSVADRSASFSFLGRTSSAGFKVIGDDTWAPTVDWFDRAEVGFDGG